MFPYQVQIKHSDGHVKRAADQEDHDKWAVYIGC